MSVLQTIASTTARCTIKGPEDNTVAQEIWFKSEPVDRMFCYRVAQLQLFTDSHDQGWVNNGKAGSWSWFEVMILPNSDATQPRIKDTRELVWRSHANRIGNESTSRHFGAMFDRRGQILDDLEPGDVIAVRLCVQYSGWVNHGESGYLVAKVLDEELFSPQSWTLGWKERPDIPNTIQDGVYTLHPTNECHVIATDTTLSSKIWFMSPRLDIDAVEKIEEIQLFTNSHDQGSVGFPEAGSWSWFDIVILDNPESTVPKVKDGLSLVWSSHSNKLGDKYYSNRDGKKFERDDVLLRSLEVGDVIAVRACAKFTGWKNHGMDAQLVIRISNREPRRPRAELPNVERIRKDLIHMQEAILRYYKGVTPPNMSVFRSDTTALLSGEIRADQVDDFGKPPLRLLSLDGGGVRGVSSLRMLKEVMLKATDDENAKPCDYFDMIAGTSTGGLIALMLGRLEMTIKECEDAYSELSQEIFERGTLGKAKGYMTEGARYDATVLENAIKRIVERKTQDKEAKMFSKDSKCKVVVVSLNAGKVNDNDAVLLRTYVNPAEPGLYGDWTIWQAARATSAAPTYFEALQVGNERFVDGGLAFNNPLPELLKEALTTFGQTRPIGCLLTIGTGIPDPVGGLGEVGVLKAGAIIKALVATATNSERAHTTLEPVVARLPNAGKEKYCRLNVGRKLVEEGWMKKVDPSTWERIRGKKPADQVSTLILEMDDWKNMDRLVAMTDKYLVGEMDRLTKFASKLVLPNPEKY